MEVIATYDTAGSAKMVADSGQTDAAAIASARAGDVFGLKPLASGIQDFSDNITRFLVIGRRPLKNAVADKTTIVFTAPERAGRAVQGAQRVRVARRRPDEARVAADSRPPLGIPVLRRPGAQRDDTLTCSRALSHLAEFAPMLRTLGSYPSWKPSVAPVLPDPFEVVS